LAMRRPFNYAGANLFGGVYPQKCLKGQKMKKVEEGTRRLESARPAGRGGESGAGAGERGHPPGK